MESEDMEYIKTFFKYSEVGIKSRNLELYESIFNYGQKKASYNFVKGFYECDHKIICSRI